MNDFAISTQTISRSGLQGLPQRLVIDGLVADTAMIDAIAAAKERRVGVVSYLVEHNMAWIFYTRHYPCGNIHLSG